MIPQTQDLTSIKLWAERADSLGNRGLRRAWPWDVKTRFGTIIDGNCLGSDSAKNKKIIHYLESSIAYAMVQAGRCYKAYGFREMTDAITVIRRFLVKCETMGDAAAGLETNEWDDMRDPQQKMLISKGVLKIHLKNPDTYLPDMASHFLHEYLHTTRADNTAWHNQALKEHRPFNCLDDPDMPSVFKDRIYFFTAACVPNGGYGHHFYHNKYGISCKGVCNFALTKNDNYGDEEQREFIRKKGGTNFYSRQSARLACGRLKSKNGQLWYLKNEVVLIKRLAASRMIYTEDTNRILGDSLKLFLKSLTPAGLPESNLLLLKIHRLRLSQVLTQFCSLTINRNHKLCLHQGRQVLSVLQRMILVVADIKNSDLDIFTPWSATRRNVYDMIVNWNK